MLKTTDMFERMKFQLPQNLSFQAKTYAASRESKTELLMLVSDSTVNIRLKMLNVISMEFMECIEDV